MKYQKSEHNIKLGLNIKNIWNQSSKRNPLYHKQAIAAEVKNVDRLLDTKIRIQMNMYANASERADVGNKWFGRQYTRNVKKISEFLVQ